MIRTEIDSMPQEMDDIAREIIEKEIEEAALSKDTEARSKEKLAKVQEELANLRDNFKEMKAKWELEKQDIGKVQKLREEIEKVNADIELAQREYDLNKAAELQYGRLPQLQKELEAEEKKAEAAQGKNKLLRDKVTDEEIARIDVYKRQPLPQPPQAGLSITLPCFLTKAANSSGVQAARLSHSRRR